MGGEKRQKISYITRKISLHIFCDHEISTCESRRGKKGHQNLRWGGSTTGGPSTTRSLRSIDHSQKRQKKIKKTKEGHKNLTWGARPLGEPSTTPCLRTNNLAQKRKIQKKKTKKSNLNFCRE